MLMAGFCWLKSLNLALVMICLGALFPYHRASVVGAWYILQEQVGQVHILDGSPKATRAYSNTAELARLFV